METNIILAGVGGQGIVSISFVIDMAAIWQGLQFKQAEVHGMSQRGGAVSSHLRISDSTVHSDLVPKGAAQIVLSVEPVESLRYVDYLSPTGTLVAGTDPFVNIPDYPEVDKILDGIATLPSHTLVAADRLARQAGSGRAQNMVLLGAASPYLGLKIELLERGIREAFAAKGEKIQKTNIDAFHSGIAAGEAYRACLKAGMASRQARALVGRIVGGKLAPEAVPMWKDLFAQPVGAGILEVLTSQTAGKIQGSVEIPAAIAAADAGAREQLPALLFKA
ncbi:MAG: indolepyruvate oxidoreductase subunit beta [Deltaproteobacteria bacterium]|nr:indolepyruvate oxidoreductase subunit beta [Deltaproteobacteria bacterium]